MDKRVIDLNSEPVLEARTPSRKQWIILAALLPVLAAWCFLPGNVKWLQEKVIPYYSSLPYEVKHMGKEERLSKRFKNAYDLTREVARQAQFDTSKLILMPAASYFASRGISYAVPEPAVFYYYSGVRTVWTNSPEAIKAHYIAIADHKTVRLITANPDQVRDSLKAWKKFQPSL